MPADVVIVPYTSRIKITHHRRIEADLEREQQLHEKYAPLQKYWSDPFLFATPQKPRRFSGGAFAIAVRERPHHAGAGCR